MLTLTQVKECINDLGGRSELEKLIERYSEEIIEAALQCDISPSDIEDSYSGQFKNDEDFAQNLAEEIGAIDKNVNWPNNCIDWERAANELMYDYVEDNGHYFRNC